MKNFLTSIILAVICSGCATTEITSFVDPDYRDKVYKVSTLLVRATGTTLQETLAFENALEEKTKKYGIQIIKFTDLVPPTRSASPEEIASIIKKTKANSILTLSIISRDEIIKNVPVTYHPGTTTSYVSTVGGISTVNTRTSGGYTTGGYSTSDPVLHSLFLLTDISTGMNIWKAEAKSSSEGGYSHLELMFNAVESALGDMSKHGYLMESPQK